MYNYDNAVREKILNLERGSIFFLRILMILPQIRQFVKR